ncbi:MAG TPA: hypothetical protein PLS84_03210 [Salinivirgaceae bacterium]|nr:hypothetical protein [Salinivirgaceae bacterium]
MSKTAIIIETEDFNKFISQMSQISEAIKDIQQRLPKKEPPKKEYMTRKEIMNITGLSIATVHRKTIEHGLKNHAKSGIAKYHIDDVKRVFLI